ncbi:MAG: protein kinase [Thermoguttaceae bacterium]
MASDLPTDSFWSLLRQSGLLADAQFAALQAEFASGAAKADGSSRNLAEELIKRGVLTDWQAENLLQGKHRGFRLGPYRILKPLGQGGMSRVFLGEHEVMHRRCAIKVLPSKYQADPDLLSRFRLEARAVGALDHPNIVRAYDFNKEESYGKEIYYLVMEFVDGQDLRHMVDQQGPLDYRKAADLIAQAAEGLAHAHAAGFVHRDIKPANLLVDANGVLKILDLGLARFTFEGDNPWETLEADPSAVGTADYVPPEQVADPRSVDGRSDIYSLGLTFYYLLTSHRPFPKPTLLDVLMAHRTEQPEPIIDVRPDVPFDLIDIIDRMIAKAPLQRFQTAKEVAEAIRRFLSESPSGREYSRISELMAAAMRAKQPPPADGKATKAPAPQELELAAIEEDPQKPSGGARQHHKTSAGESGKLPAGKRPVPSDSKPSLPKPPTDVFSELLPGELNSSGSAALFQYRRKRKVLQSPLAWIGLAAVGVAIAAMLIALSTGPSRQGPTSGVPGGSPLPKPVNMPAPTPKEKPAPETLPAGLSQDEANRALAGLDQVWLAINSNISAGLLPIVTDPLHELAGQLNIDVVKEAPPTPSSPTLLVLVNVEDHPSNHVVTLTVELKVAVKGSLSTVWKLSRKILDIPRRGSRSEQIQQVQEGLTKGSTEVFEQFATAVREARAKTKAD